MVDLPVANREDNASLVQVLDGVHNTWKLRGGSYDSDACLTGCRHEPIFGIVQVVGTINILKGLEALWSGEEEGWGVSTTFLMINEWSFRMPP